MLSNQPAGGCAIIKTSFFKDLESGVVHLKGQPCLVDFCQRHKNGVVKQVVVMRLTTHQNHNLTTPSHLQEVLAYSNDAWTEASIRK
jgi:hypothetical protein